MFQKFDTIESCFLLKNEFDLTMPDVFVTKRYRQLVLEIGQPEAIPVRQIKTFEKSDYYQSLFPQYKTKILKKEFKNLFIINYGYIDSITAQEIFLAQASETSIFNKSSIEDAIKEIRKSKSESEIKKRLGMGTEDLLPIKDKYTIEEIEITEKELAGLNLDIKFDKKSIGLQCPNCKEYI